MPANSIGIHQKSDHGLTVTARTPSGDDRHTRVCLAGEIDMASSAVMSETLDWLISVTPVSVLVDLSELTFAGSTLCHFVVRIRQLLPDGAELILWRASPAIEWVLRVTEMAAIATIADEPTEPLAALV